MIQKQLQLLICLFLTCTSVAQTYNFRNYSEDEGLPQAYIYNITQDSNGYVYLSTGEGFCVFDGATFTPFTTNEIADNFVTTHFIDSKKTAWLGHFQNGISYLKDGKFNKLKSKEISDYRVTQFAEDTKHHIWISTLGGGFFIVDEAFNLKALNCPEAMSVSAFCFDFDHSILAATTNGLFVLNKNNPVKVDYEIKELHDKNIKCIYPVNKSNTQFWVAVENEGVYGISYTGKEYTVFSHILPELKSQQNNISCIYSDREENLWVGLFGEGLRKIMFYGDPKENKFSVIKIDHTNGLINGHIQSIMEDFEGNMWFGTFGAGLIEKPVEKFTFYGEKEGIVNDNVENLVVDNNGTLWMANTKGLSRYNPQSYSFLQYDGTNGFITDKINTLLFDHSGLLWIGTENNGIYTFDTLTHKFENFSKNNALTKATITTIIQVKDEIIIGTTEGIYYYNLDKKLIKEVTTTDGLILHNSIKHLFNDSKNRLWISSHGSPPYYIKNNKIKVFNDIPELRSFNVNAVCEDMSGNIWIATERDGVFKYDGSKFLNYKTYDGLISNYCYGITVDHNNSVWVTHKNGLSEKKFTHKLFTGFALSEGVLFVENNLNALYKDTHHGIWYGTTQGIVHYNSEVEKNNTNEPKLSILRIKLNKKLYFPKEEIIEKHGYYSVHIEFLAISLINPKKVKYKYRLLGLDSVWKETNQRFVDFSNLSDGDYTFQLLACNNEGLWTSHPAELYFSITKPVWKRAWFYVVLLTVIIILIYNIVYWRTRNLRKSKLLLQKLIDQKTLLLQKEKDEVEKIKMELEIKNKNITDSINYAKRIQDSLLPPDEVLRELFDNNYFIFYKPKDIVSGDFYWAASATTTGNQPKSFSLAAVADCTGHGVPGAFLSIVASNFLNQSLSEESVNSTSEALDFLNINITSNLNQSSKLKNRMQDGMDIAMIGIDYKSSKLYYSGANNSIYIYRRTDEGTQINILKPTKRAIGSGMESEFKYDLQLFDLQAGDTIYLFSDGFADQFGGDRDKKLNYKRFKEILIEAFELPIGLQRGFLDEKFEAWRGNSEQTDDVCVMGIKI